MVFAGINVVLDKVRCSLYSNYKVKIFYGIRFGFKGINKYK